jgi:hypothetical protein
VVGGFYLGEEEAVQEDERAEAPNLLQVQGHKDDGEPGGKINKLKKTFWNMSPVPALRMTEGSGKLQHRSHPWRQGMYINPHNHYQHHH